MCGVVKREVSERERVEERERNGTAIGTWKKNEKNEGEKKKWDAQEMTSKPWYQFRMYI